MFLYGVWWMRVKRGSLKDGKMGRCVGGGVDSGEKKERSLNSTYQLC